MTLDLNLLNLQPALSLQWHHQDLVSITPYKENSEPDSIKWGNAENPPTVVYHEDAPKGFKRFFEIAKLSNYLT